MSFYLKKLCRKVFLCTLFTIFFTSVYAQNSLSTIFNSYGIKGSTTIYDYKDKKWLYSDSVDAGRALQPASTFKIINLLIGLQTKVIKDEMAVIKWPGKTDTLLYGYRPDIYRDISIKEAFEVSAGWAYIEMAKKIDRKQYLYYLEKSGYGNLDLSEKGDDFWNFGPMKISPRNQIEFLIRVYEGKTPFSKRNIDILKRVMVTEKTATYTVRSKTGWTRTEGKDIGWWVGYLETRGNVYFFATRLTKPLAVQNPKFGAYRKDITKAALNDLYKLGL